MERGRVLLTTLVATVAGAACNQVKTSGPDLPFASGTRLRAQLHDGGAGATKFLGFFDTELGTRCAFDRAEDGRLRCLPVDGDTFTLEFADAACTQPVWRHTCGDVPTHVSQPVVGASNCAVPQIRSRQLTTSTVATTFYKTESMCVSNGPLPPGVTAYLVGAPIAPATFVAAEIEDVPLSNGLVAQRVVAEDGARLIVGVRDPAARDCRPGTHADDPEDVRCVPSQLATVGGLFGDAACTEGIAFDEGSALCPIPDVIREDAPGSACASPVTYRTVGAEIPFDQVYGLSAISCAVLSAPPDSLRFYRLGDPLAWSDFAALAIDEVGAGPLRSPYHTGLNGELLLTAGGFVDAERNVPCQVVEVEGAGLRCLPASARGATGAFYADSSCDPAGRLYPSNRNPCSAALPDQVFLTTSTTCAPVIDSVHTRGPEHAGTVYHHPDWMPEYCVEFTEGLPDDHFYVVGEPLDSMTFPAVTARTE